MIQLLALLAPLLALLAVLPQPVSGQSQTAELVVTDVQVVNGLWEYHYVLHNRGLGE